MKNFDHFVAIDWSGAEKPLNNLAISVAICGQGEAAPQLIPGPWSRQAVAEWIIKQSSQGGRRLIGFDCNFSYAESVAMQQLGENYTVMDLWASVDALCEGIPNFFAKPFWEKYASFFWLSGRQPAWFHYENLQRDIEKHCALLGFGYPESPFKLFSQKQVGKGGLAGMRLAYFIKQKLGKKISFWPYEFESKETTTVVTEIYPRLFWRIAGLGNKKIIDKSLLNKALEYFASNPLVSACFKNNHDTDALISAAGMRWLSGREKEIPKTLIQPPCMNREKAKREGWIFGVRDTLV